MPGSSASAACARLISPAPGRNTSRSPSLSSRSTRRTAPATCTASGRSSGAGRCSIATSNIRPSLRTTTPPEEVSDRIGVERRGHRDDRQVGAIGLAQPAQPGEREVGRDVALVQLVEHDRADAGQARRRQQPPHEQPLGDEPKPRAGPDRPRRTGPNSRRSRRHARRARPRRGWRRAARAAGAARAPRSPGRGARARAARAAPGSSCPRPAAPPPPRRPGPRRRRRWPAGTRRSAAAGAAAAPSSSVPCPSMGLPGEPAVRPGADVGDTPTFAPFTDSGSGFAVIPRPPIGYVVPMIRCSTCGRRVRDAAPVCPAHGPPPPAPPPSEDKTVPFVVPPPALAELRVQKTLGQGGFGAVFLAERVSDEQLVAIKVARADNASAGEALLREADALAAIGVPHVPAVFDRGVLDNGSTYVVMEFVRAEVLSERLGALPGPMDLEEFSRHALAILNVIEIAHGKGLVHCDLKPENVFIDPVFGAKLFDFGLVRMSAGAAKQIEATKEEAPAGTPEYMSPEQCEARTDIDARSDIYALGVMFYEMLAGAPPFWGNSVEVQQNHRSRRPPALSRRTPVAVALEEAIMRCLAKDPERRFGERHRDAPGAAGGPGRGAGASGSDGGEGGAGSRRCDAKPGEAAKPAAKPAAAARERRVVALLFFESKSNVAAIRDAGTAVGAQLAHTAGVQYVLAFGHEVGDNPTRAAANAGEAFIARGFAKAVLVDLASVSVQARPDGTPPLPEPAVRQEGSVSWRRRSGGRVAVAGGRRGAAGRVQRGGREPARVHAAAEGRAGVGADDDAHGRRAARRPRRAAALAHRSGARRRRPARVRRSRRSWASRATARRTSRRCWCSTSRCRRACRRSSCARRRCWAAWASRRRASCCSARSRCPTWRPPISAAGCWRSGWATTPPRRSGGASRSRWRGRRRSTRSCARWRQRRARCVRRRRARSAKRCAGCRARSRWLWSSRTRTSSTRPPSTGSSTPPWSRPAARSGCAWSARPAFGRGRTAWASRAAKQQQITLPPLESAGRRRAGASAARARGERADERAVPAGRPHAGHPDVAGRARARPQARRPGSQVGEGPRLVPRHRRAGTAPRPSAGAVALQP